MSSSNTLRRQEKLVVLQLSPLFADLHADELELLADLCLESEFAAGDVIVRQGDPGDSVFVVEEGLAKVIRASETGDQTELISLSQGQFFGEMSVIERSTRSATVVAVEDCRVLSLTTDDLYSFARIFMNGFTLVIINIARVLSQRLRSTTGELMRQKKEGDGSVPT